MRKISTNPSTHERVADIEKRVLELSKSDATPYHEYHRDTTERGFSKITLAQPRLRRNAVGGTTLRVA